MTFNIKESIERDDELKVIYFTVRMWEILRGFS